MKLLISIVLLLQVFTGVNCIADIKNATINISKSRFHRDTTSKDILGVFYEQLADFVSGPCGFSAEELVNRGFDHIVYSDSIPSGEVYAWELHKTDSNKINISREIYNPNGIASLLFEKRKNEKLSIKQNIILSDSCNYIFYLYGKNLNANISKLSVKLSSLTSDSNLVIIDEKIIEIDSNDWKKYVISLKGVFSDSIINNSSFLTISVLNNCKFQIDEMSLIPDNNILGVRKEHFELFKTAKIGNLRYPGGWFADSGFNLWKNELLNRDKRRSTFFVGYSKNPQRVEFGILEYLKFCKLLDIKPYLTVNIHYGTADDAADLVEFCNSDTNSKYGRIRMQLGDTLPYNVKFWEIGNENWPDKIGYTKKYLDFYSKMTSKDSTIVTIINGNAWDENSFDVLMNIVKDKCTIFGYHTCKVLFNEPKNNEYKKYLHSVETQSEQNYINELINKIKNTNYNPNLKLGNTEWWTCVNTGNLDWVTDKYDANAELKASFWSTNSAMIYLNNPEYMKVGCRTMGINFIKREINSKGKKSIYGTPAFHSFSMLSNHFANNVHYYDIQTEKFSNYEDALWVTESPYIDALVTSSKDTLFLAVVNKYPYDTAYVSLLADSLPIKAEATKYELWSEDYNDMNTPDEPNKIVEKVFKKESIYKNVLLKPHSFNIFAIPIKFKNGNLELNTIDISVDDGNVQLNDLSSLKFNVNYKYFSNSLEILSETALRNINVEVYSSTGELVSSRNYFDFETLNYLNVKLLSGAYYVKISDAKNKFVMLPMMVVN